MSALTVIPGFEGRAGGVTVDYAGDDEVCRYLLEGGMLRDLLAAVVQQADTLVPDGVVWRIHITADMPRSVADLDSAYATTEYTVDRGTNTVAGKTVRQEDGSFDVLLAPVLFYPPSPDDAGVTVMATNLLHTVIHEALHVVIDARGEDTHTVVASVEHLPANEQIWSRHMGYMLEDYRIESTLSQTIANPTSWATTIADDLALFETERRLSYEAAVGRGEYRVGLDIMLKAAVNLTRSLAYLTAETSDPTPSLSGEALERWNRFVAPTWERWVATYGSAAPAIETMTAAEVASVIGELAALAPEFLLSVGFEHTIAPNGDEGAWWLNGFDW